MKILAQSLIVWLLFLAVPFQGFASASMLMCAPMQATAQMAAMEHDHPLMMGAQAVHGDGNSAVQGRNDDAAEHHHGSGKCNTCATCCFGAAMAPSSTVRVPAEPPQLVAFYFEAGRVARVDLALPERPPSCH